MNIKKLIDKLEADPEYIKKVNSKLRDNNAFGFIAVNINQSFYKYLGINAKQDAGVLEYMINHFLPTDKLEFNEDFLKTNVKYQNLYLQERDNKINWAYYGIYKYLCENGNANELDAKDIKAARELGDKPIAFVNNILYTGVENEEDIAIYRDRYGLDDGEPKSLREMAHKYNKTTKSIADIHNQVNATMWLKTRNNDYKTYRFK